MAAAWIGGFVGFALAGRDTHNGNFDGTARQAAVLEQAMSALLAKLHAKRLLDQTLVVLGTEFARTTRINDNDGRDTTITFLLAGAGIGGCFAPTVTTSRGHRGRRRSSARR